ncbi:unnamed protein product [Adineta ricciae]|uniref:Uncharacterized protein n=1 Tax=Adineta ricciae TaxID=249248 RepID=A0A814R0U4_ADIRI|nr:unnamed protein product [Adineta ricciae]
MHPNLFRRKCLLTTISLAISYSILYYLILYSNINKKPFPVSKPLPYRGCIVSLIRSDKLVSLNRLLNMLNSLTLYFRNIHQYPILLFHEPTLENETKRQILYCASKLNIRFYEIHFNVTIPSNRSGYASMCQFWSYDIWFKYNILRSQCDYVMRFDDDSYLANSTANDLFEEFHRNQLDYAYRVIYRDNNGLDFIRDNLRSFLATNKTRSGCIELMCSFLNGPYGYDGLAIYNNFFLIRLDLMYEHKVIERYLKQLIALDAFYRYRVGDANIQTICLLLIDKPVKISSMNFPYAHNVHGASDVGPAFSYFDTVALMWYFTMKTPNVTCKSVFIASRYTLTRRNV